MIELLLEAESALSLGLLDRAEILYRQIAGADPRNSIAVVGLARVLLERGDEAGALKQARRALAIDAENTAAQRMVQRLEEVLQFRGADVDAAARPTQASGPRPRPAPAATATSAHSAPPAALTTRTPEDHLAPTEPTPEEPPPIQPRASPSLIDRLLRRRA